jgi:copper homeostasis protein
MSGTDLPIDVVPFSSVLVEVVVQSIEDLLAARAGSADRVEVCVDLAVGGLTPPLTLVRDVVAAAGPVGVHVLVRSRPGDYVYTPAEVGDMVASIEAVDEAGADGVVVGALTAEGEVDVDSCRRMIDAAGRMSVTFHRAFDVAGDPFAALDAIAELGCDRILTSGQAATAPEGAAVLRRLVERSAGRLVILAGGGIRAGNVAQLIDESWLSEIHFSLAGAGGVDATLAAARLA